MLRIFLVIATLLLSIQVAFAKPVTLLVLGDSLTAGLGLEAPGGLSGQAGGGA